MVMKEYKKDLPRGDTIYTEFDDEQKAVAAEQLKTMLTSVAATDCAKDAVKFKTPKRCPNMHSMQGFDKSFRVSTGKLGETLSLRSLPHPSPLGRFGITSMRRAFQVSNMVGLVIPMTEFAHVFTTLATVKLGSRCL